MLIIHNRIHLIIELSSYSLFFFFLLRLANKLQSVSLLTGSEFPSQLLLLFFFSNYI